MCPQKLCPKKLPEIFDEAVRIGQDIGEINHKVPKIKLADPLIRAIHYAGKFACQLGISLKY